MNSFRYLILLILLNQFVISSEAQHRGKEKKDLDYTGNPILPGNFADPFILVYQDTVYIYATGGGAATVWRSADFVNWKLTRLNWPTSMKLPSIWAPAVAKAPDGKFYLYTSVNHNIYVGVADHPAGPFRNVLGNDSIFIKNRQWWNKMHSIDADCFVDDDGQAYLYWGSGFDFRDGICAVGKLGSDMASFRETPKLITPSGYFEGPHMMKRKGKYYLMYSDGLYYDSSYKVRYAVSDHPDGPFVEGKNSPVLTSSPDGIISGPGHHSTIRMGDEYYIVYHRHAQPLYPSSGPIRQVCIEKLEFEKDGSIKKLKGTWTGVSPGFMKKKNNRQPIRPVSVTASSSMGESFDASKAFDGSFGTLWAADKKQVPASITADLGRIVSLSSCEPFFDLVNGDYSFRVECSTDNSNWDLYAEGNNGTASEWPLQLAKNMRARFVRLTILQPSKEPKRVGLWEIRLYGK